MQTKKKQWETTKPEESAVFLLVKKQTFNFYCSLHCARKKRVYYIFQRSMKANSIELELYAISFNSNSVANTWNYYKDNISPMG